jgi:hypothetical protein
LCRTPADWAWSSFRKTVAGTAPRWLDQRRLLGFFDDRPKNARRRYIDMSVAAPYDPSR